MIPTEDQEVARKSRGLASIGAIAKTDSAALTLSTPCRRIWVGGTGTLVLTFIDGSTATLEAIPTGTMLDQLAVTAIGASSTATKVVALY